MSVNDSETGDLQLNSSSQETDPQQIIFERLQKQKDEIQAMMDKIQSSETNQNQNAESDNEVEDDNDLLDFMKPTKSDNGNSSHLTLRRP